MANDYNMNDLFHPNVDMGATSSSKNANEYSPSADKGQNGVYKSIIRFVSWWQDPHHSYVDKWACWLVDPLTERGKSVDCPSSVGKPSILQDMFFKLRKSESIQEQKKSEIFSRKHVYAAIIQVIKDDQNKDLEGKLLVWKFGKKVFEKYEAEKKPLIGDPGEPFDLLDGKAFALVITKVAGYNNYDQSKFLDKKVPLLLPFTKDGKVAFGKDSTLRPITEKTPSEMVFNFLKENSPDLNEYKYKDWDQDTHDYVNQVILAVTGQNTSSAYADARNNSGKASSPKNEAITTSELTVDDLDTSGSNSLGSISDLDLPDVPENMGIAGNLDDALDGL